MKGSIKIGLLFSLTGTTAIGERGQYQAARLAIEQVNKNGGIGGLMLEPVLEDVCSSPIVAQEKARSLIERDEVLLLLGTYTSASRKAVLPVLEEHNKLLLYPALYEGEEQSPFVYYCGSLPNQQLDCFLPWILRHLGRRLYLIGSDYIYPYETHKRIRRLLQQCGGQAVGEQYYALGTKNFEAALQEIDHLQPDVIFSTLVGESVVDFYRQYRKQGFSQPICSTVTSETEVHAMGLAYALGHYSSLPYFQTIRTAENEAFLEAYQKAYPCQYVSSYMENAYNSVFLLEKALKRADGLDTPSIRKAMREAEILGPQGRIRLDGQTQHCWMFSRIAQVTNDGFQILWESDRAIRPLPFTEEYSSRGKTALFARDLEQSKEHWQGCLDRLEEFSAFYPYVFYFLDEDGVILGQYDKGCPEPEENLAGCIWTDVYPGKNAVQAAFDTGEESIMQGEEHAAEALKTCVTMGVPMIDGNRCLAVVGVRAPIDLSVATQEHMMQMLRWIGRVFTEVQAERDKRNLLEEAIDTIQVERAEGIVIARQSQVLYANQWAKTYLQTKHWRLEQVIDEALKAAKFSEEQHIVRLKIDDRLLEVRVTQKKDIVHLSMQEVKQDQPVIPADGKITFDHIVGVEPCFLQAIDMAKTAAQTNANILILGESGTGKELFAHAIHHESPRKNQPFVAINCGAIPKELIQAELFGYADGAFTGAKKGGRPGKFEAANGGTLFLDEIGDMPLNLQVNLLRVIQEKEVTRIGDHRPVKIDVRIIAATNKNLVEEIAYNGSFRSDLYYRINIFTIELAPLRERKRDIKELAEYFLGRLNRLHRTEKTLSEKVLERFQTYHWPGNIRELQNLVERAYYFSKAQRVIDEHHLTAFLQKAVGAPFASGQQPTILDLSKEEKARVLKLLQETNANLSQVARQMGISRNTLYKKLDRYQIEIRK